MKLLALRSASFLLLLFVISTVSGARQNPLKNPKVCGRPQCDVQNKKFGYSDNVYSYEYNAHVTTEFEGTGDDTSDLAVKADVDLLFPKPCEGFLRINSARLSDDKNGAKDHAKSQAFQQDVTKNVLRFDFHDGLINEVCPDANEPVWVLNFKKGILSALQNTMLRFDVDFNTTETDVSGTCGVHYSLASTANAYVTIRKDKDLRSCHSRFSTHSFLQTVPYAFSGGDNSVFPLLDSESHCNLTIDNHIYREVNCFERHQLIPFSKQSSGAVTSATYSLQFKGEQHYSPGEFLEQHGKDIKKRSPLTFDHTPLVKPTHGEIKASRELLKQMCAAGSPKIQREFIDIFTKFLQTTKNLDYKALSQLLQRADSIGPNGRNHVLESLPYIGSTASYQVMRDQIVDDKFDEKTARNWMTHMSFIQRPDDATLDTFFTILEFSRKKANAEYTLGATAVVHNYCKHNENCEKNSKIKRIVNLLETEFLSLFNTYKGERQNRERMVVILKGLGNIGVLSGPFAAQLQDIISQEAQNLELRLESALAFRRVDCMKYRQFFLDTYGKYNLNSEVRTVAYLQAMRCPDHQSVGRVKAILNREEVNQVGSYVYSHLKNLAKSSSPTRIETQGLLQADDLPDKFKMDIRKFSRNYDFSVFFDEYNVGTTTDVNVIFGTDSYLPRMATWNFTTELFGQSINFFELSARTEGFDQAISGLFGAQGPFNSEFFSEKLAFLTNSNAEGGVDFNSLFNTDNLRLKREVTETEAEDVEEDNYDFEEELYRPRRAAPAMRRKKEIRRQVRDIGYQNDQNHGNQNAQIGLRIFGNDIRYYTMEEAGELFTKVKDFDLIDHISKLLSGEEVTFSKSRVFLDTSYNVPLAVGLPMAIHAYGASSVDMRMFGTFEKVENMDWHYDVNGKFKPSVSLDVITSMQSDFFHAISGIKVKSNLYSNSEVEASLKIRGKSQVSFTFDLPQETNEIFSARSEILVLQHDKEVPQKGIASRRSNSTCTWPVLDKAIGLQLCSDFSVPDVVSGGEDKAYPCLLLSGPMEFNVKLKKSDPSAHKYVFEYNYDKKSEDESNWSLIFHTPGSSVKRVMVTNVTSVPDNFKATMQLISGRSEVNAGCHYQNQPNDRRLDVYMDTNGKRNFDLNMELARWQDRTTMMYKPKLLLAINGVNVTGLLGSIRVNEKNGISQNGFELSFETKKLQAVVTGEFVTNEVLTSTNLSVNYRFQSNKVETINFEAKLQNNGDKSKTEYVGQAKMTSSAYPKLNFIADTTWLSLQGHTEGTMTFNSGKNFMDQRQASTMRVIFARAYNEDQAADGSITRASFEIKVPKSKVDYKISFKHEERSKNGTEHNVLLGLRYATEKEATGLFSIHLPKRNLFAVDAYFNVTVPEFDSCTAKVKVTETSAKNYQVNLSGSWFTGHSATVKGNYKDKSSRVQSLHNAKFTVESPSFKATTITLNYRRTQQLFSFDVQAKYDKDPYGLTVQYNDNAAQKNCNGEIRLKLNDKDYWATAKVSEEPKSLVVEIHLDKLRDIHAKANVVSLDKRKELNFELKWDANRDPAQRLAVLAAFNNPSNDRYDGSLEITYPDRTISCGFEANTAGPQYHGSARVSWSTNDLITFNYDVGLMPGKDVNNWVNAELNTPFQGWRRNSMKAGFYSGGNLLLANSSFVWADNQSLDLSFKSDHQMQGPVMSCEMLFGLKSTVTGIPEVNVKLSHYQDKQKYDTMMSLIYSGLNEMNEYSLKSVWEVTKNGPADNISGTVHIVTPFEGYRKGGLSAQLTMNDRHEIKGGATLDFEDRQFTFNVDGYVRKLADSKLTVIITTPLEKYRTLEGRFGLNEKQRHAVAEIRSPDGALGLEILADFVGLMDFDVKLSVATPIENFRQAAVVAKVKPNTVDVRGTYNNATLGFTGVWRMEGLNDFEYSYTVYTPLQGFEESGFVVKFVAKDNFVLEMHARFSTHKAGLKVNGHPKSKLQKQLVGNKLQMLYDEDFRPPQYNPSEYDPSKLDYNEFLSYSVTFEVDPLIMDSLHGGLDVQEVLDFYLLVGHVQWPEGRIDVKDRLYYPDYVNALNVLTVKTPFEAAKEVKSIVEYRVDINQWAFYEKVKFVLHDNTNEPKVTSVEVDYKKVVDSVKPNEHSVQINVKTPLITLAEMNVWGKIQLEDNVYRGNISSRTPNTFVSLAAALEFEENFTESSVDFVLNTDVVPHYGCRAYFKNDFNDKDNTVDMQFSVTDNDVVNEIKVGTAWHKDPSHLVNVNGHISTTMLPLKLAETSLKVATEPHPSLSFDLSVVGRNGERADYGTRASKKSDAIDVEVWTPIEDFRNISMHGSLTQSPKDPNEYSVSGKLYRNMHTYGINGIIKMANGYPTDTRLRVQPSAGGPDGVIEFSVSEPQSGGKGYNFQFSAIQEGKMCQISGGYSASNETGVDFSMLIESSVPELKRINFNGQFRPRGKGHTVGDVSLETPWKDLGIENVKLHSDLNLKKDGGKVAGEYRFSDYVGRGSCAWTWILAENMQLALESNLQRPNMKTRSVHASAKYLNPQKNFQKLSTAVKMDVDAQWKMETNGTLNYRNQDDVQASLVTTLPKPIGDTHNLNFRYKGNLVAKKGVKPEFFFEGKYKSKDAQRNGLGRVSYKNATDVQASARLEWGEKKDVSAVEGDFHMQRKGKVRREFYTKLVTPKYKDEDTFYVKGSYDLVDKFHQVVASMGSPASRQLADMDMAFKDLSNMHGYVNASTPLPTMSWLKTEFDFNTKGPKTTRHAQASWPSDKAFFKSQSTYNEKPGQSDVKGNIEIEVPLLSRHRAEIEYGLREKNGNDNGFVKANYNGKQVLNGVYKSVKDTKGQVQTVTKDITLENEMKPLGIKYVNKQDKTRPEELVDVKRVEVYELKNAGNFKLSGEVTHVTKPNGHDVKIVASHPNRTVVWTSSYDDAEPNKIKTHSRLELTEDAWLAYNLELSNKTTGDVVSHSYLLDVSYPKRNLSTEGSYSFTDDQLQYNAVLKWNTYLDDDMKAVRTGLVWKKQPLTEGVDLDHQTFVFTIGHPSLDKDVTFKGKYYRGKVDLLNTDLVIDYANDESHAIKLGALVQDLESQLGHTNYTVHVYGNHQASDIDLQFNGSMAARPDHYKTEASAAYKKQYFTEKAGQLLALLNLEDKEFEYIRTTPTRCVRLWAVPVAQYPIYGLNASVWDTPDTNNTGYIYIDLLHKYLRAEVNLTEDDSQNLQLVGTIPDARSAYLDIWRNYEDIRIIDVSSYVKMNHSRLVTGRFHWRPKVRHELKNKVFTVTKSIFSSFSDGLDFWVKAIYTEAVESLEIIWETQKRYNNAFFDDMHELAELEDDITELRNFINESYESNDFYIKDVINFLLAILDELAIKDHIESLPQIFTELWQTMGESGKALRESILTLIEKIKTSYNEFLVALSRFFRGDSLQYISELLEQGVHKYDRFVKELHISFIKYVQNLWNKSWTMLTNYWQGVFKRIEPHVFKFISQLEATLWDLSKELFDFIYKRTNELAESPYFNKVSSFTQDVDRLYRDIKSHDALTNIRKYSVIIWNFLKEKYFKLVPFGKELNEVLTEIWEEIQELRKIEQVAILIEKYNEIVDKLEWVAKELELEERLHKLYALLLNKLNNYANNALETADKYRKPKTKFIFDPEAGIMDLEQKLPMSWHAFNETPRFEEIPELRVVAKVHSILTSTNSSMIRNLYNLKHHLDPKTWLPPYYSRALIIDSRHYMTFDQRFVGLNLRFEEMTDNQRNQQCSYLLSHDFFQGNFTLLLEPSINVSSRDMISTRKLSFIANDELIEIDLGGDSITINDDPKYLLPVKLGGVTISRDLDILTITSDTEFSLSCNVQYDLCWFEVSGWYFGQTAGLLGTMNNEPYDEYTTSYNNVTTDMTEFTDSWSVQRCKQKMKSAAMALDVPKEVAETCDYYFKSGMLSACADSVDPKPFYDICLDLGSNSNEVKPGHPANKGACTAALAYIEACASANILMRVPDNCIFCKLTNGSFVPEGSFVQLSSAENERSSDVVFIVEAKPCNTNLTEHKSMMTIVESLEEQLNENQLTNNRYAVVTFGGIAPFDTPRSIYYENSVFTHDYRKLEAYFAHINTSNSTNSDILQAISTASRLNFRPGVSKTFILLACSNCAARNMLFDYSSILQFMQEEGVNLHILADTEFEFEKTRKLRHFFGMDHELVYSKRFPEGDAETRKALYIPKSNLGICTPLAMETNGSVFSVRKFIPERKYAIKRLATIFAKRVAKSAVPSENYTCECSGHNTGVAYMACSPNTYHVETPDLDDYDNEFNDWDMDEDDMNEMDH
uniref:Vitellogenin domain-containing protein n=1 Tax=Stomoxys calcitrans TaxID=35570 RepID=A0A1I8NQH1_STOCA|nr:unnamed protein product [Stomoxys calcitrans]